MAKLLKELATDIQYMEEAASDGKHLYISGIYLQSGVKNRNGRIYPPPLMDREANRYVKEQVERGTAYGELGHPNTPGLNSDCISHRITELTKDGNNWTGKAVVIPEGKGLVVRGIIQTGGTVGVSSRGLGSLKEDKKLGAHVVQDDFRLMIGADIVMNPSAPDAWMTSMMEAESVEWSYNPATNEWMHEQAKPVRDQINKMSLRQIQERKVALFEQFMKKLSKR
jgi:hypothetical protein